MIMPIYAATVSSAGDIPNWFAVIMGIGTVFLGLVSIIVICLITGALAGTSIKADKKPGVSVGNGEDPRKRQEMIAAVSAACAEDMGTDVSKIRVVSFKKV